MASLFTFALSILFTAPSFAQVLTYENFRSLIPYMQKEDYKGAFSRSDSLLAATPNDTSEFRAIVCYMHLYAAAGMVSRQEMSHDAFEKHAKGFVGKRLVMSGHPCIDSAARGFNSLQFNRDENGLKGMTITANKQGSSILFFEYFTYAGPVDPAELLGKTVRCGGRLASLEVNPNKSTIWIARLHLEDAFARPMIPR